MENWLLISTYIVAWLGFLIPIIIFFWKKFFASIEFSPFMYCQIGFVEAGPVFDLAFSILGRGIDQNITKISIEVENNDTNQKDTLEWMLMNPSGLFLNAQDPQYQFVSSLFIKANQSKNLHVRFVNPNTNEKISEKISEFNDRYQNFLLETYPNIPLNQLSPQQLQEADDAWRERNGHLDLYQFLGDEFYWKRGEYNVCLVIETSKPNKHYQFNYKITLTEEDRKKLDLNRISIIRKKTMNEDNFILVDKKIEQLVA